MKKLLVVFIVTGFICSGISRANTCSAGSTVEQKVKEERFLVLNEADQKQETEKRANEDRERQQKAEAEKRANEDRERQQKAEAGKIGKEKIEVDRKAQDLRQHNQLQESDRKVYKDRSRNERMEADRRDQELKLRQEQIAAEKRVQEATFAKEREEAKRHAEELKKQQQHLEAERRSEEIRRKTEAHRLQKKEEERRKEMLEAQRRAEEHRRWHNSHNSNHLYDRNHYHYDNKYNDESTIIYTEEYNYYNEPYPGPEYPESPYDRPYNNQPPKTIVPPASQQAAGESGLGEEDAVSEILESEAFVPDMQISEASVDFCLSFMKCLKANNADIIFEKPVVITDDPASPDLARNFPCYKKSGYTESIAKNINMAGEQNFKLYRLKKDLSSKNQEYEYILYAEPADSTERTDLLAGFSRIDRNTCRIRHEVTVNGNDPDSGVFSSIVRYKKQYYILDVAIKGNEAEQTQKHIIRLHQYSSKKGAFEQGPYAYWTEPGPIN